VYGLHGARFGGPLDAAGSTIATPNQKEQKEDRKRTTVMRYNNDPMNEEVKEPVAPRAQSAPVPEPKPEASKEAAPQGGCIGGKRRKAGNGSHWQSE